MLTKKLKFDNDVLDVLRNMDFSADGCLGVITGGQLERGLYERVNKALSAMGGKWNRKAGGHVFQTDPRGQVEGLLANGEMTVEKDGFFETPRAVVERMLELVPLSSDPYSLTLEPSAGLGAIVRVLNEYGVGWLVMVEKNEQRALSLEKVPPRPGQDSLIIHGDFLDFQNHPGYRFDRVYMNPPFEELQDIDHVRHAYSLLANGGMLVSVMSESPFFRGDRKAVEFRVWLEEVGGTSERLPEGAFKESGTGVNTRLVIIKKGTVK